MATYYSQINPPIPNILQNCKTGSVLWQRDSSFRVVVVIVVVNVLTQFDATRSKQEATIDQLCQIPSLSPSSLPCFNLCVFLCSPSGARLLTSSTIGGPSPQHSKYRLQYVVKYELRRRRLRFLPLSLSHVALTAYPWRVLTDRREEERGILHNCHAIGNDRRKWKENSHRPNSRRKRQRFWRKIRRQSVFSATFFSAFLATHFPLIRKALLLGGNTTSRANIRLWKSWWGNGRPGTKICSCCWGKK